MIRLRIEEFSCIKKADFKFGGLSVLIGPQASGKSVVSKLAYFFIELINDQYEQILEQRSFDDFADDVKNKFSEWFPLAAWGSSKFKIEFELGEYKLRLTRTSYDESIRNNLRLWTSPLVKEHYKRTSELTRTLRQKSSRRGQGHFGDVELGWEVRDAATKVLQDEIGADFIQYQTFVPAGRSFFTTLGRAFMAFDQGSTLDPITVRFGRLYSSYQEELRFYSRTKRSGKIAAEFETLLGGQIVWEGERPILLSADGRRVPFSALSSGQQELLPLVIALSSIGTITRRRSTGASLLYIEEPEAHLFPSAQSALIEGLSALLNDPAGPRRLLLTTHSPYVLSKINNLIKAGALEKSLDASRLSELDAVVAKRSRIAPGVAKAYAIIDGELSSIVDEDGLIGAEYLDSISSQIGEQFDRLLDLEFKS
jgi:hypothetical protein